MSIFTFWVKKYAEISMKYLFSYTKYPRTSRGEIAKQTIIRKDGRFSVSRAWDKEKV